MGELQLTQNAKRVLEARYLRRDEGRNIVETPEQLFVRVAHAVAEAERELGGPSEPDRWRDAFHEMLTSLDFLPNSPTLMSAGTGLNQLSACFVIPVGDTMEAIFKAVKQMALVQRSGGGTGFSFSRLRPRNDVVASTGGMSSGPISFMRIFDCATENIKQGGKRRGANMGILRVDHPDIFQFITAKLDGETLANFNLSVGVTDAFMKALQEDERYELINPRTGEATGRLRARHVFGAITEAAWQTGDPGLIFLDRINRANPTPHCGTIEATNPCGEVPLLPYESCNLGSLNLSHMVRELQGRGRKRAEIDWEKLRKTARKAVRFLDDVIAVNTFPMDEVARATRGNRKIGLGVMGLAELLIRLGVSYDSSATVDLAEQLMKFIAREAFGASRELAEERGAFPNWKGSTYESRGIQVRNATQTSIAPTGTISMIAGTSASIEPLFALAYRREHTLGGDVLYELNPLFLEHLEEHGFQAEAIAKRVERAGRLSNVEGVPEALKKRFVTALEVPATRHLDVQAAFQRHVDNSVSKTINLPEEASKEDVRRAYRRAWHQGLKGITIYRYGSQSEQVLRLGAGEEAYHYDHASTCDPEECKV